MLPVATVALRPMIISLVNPISTRFAWFPSPKAVRVGAATEPTVEVAVDVPLQGALLGDSHPLVSEMCLERQQVTASAKETSLQLGGNGNARQGQARLEVGVQLLSDELNKLARSKDRGKGHQLSSKINTTSKV